MFGIGPKKSRDQQMNDAAKLGCKIGDMIGDALFKSAKPTKRGYKHNYPGCRRPKSAHYSPQTPIT